MRWNNDGFARCGNGHYHWGLAGAAGWLNVWIDDAGTRRFMLVRRANVHNSGMYSIPGGAIDPGETAVMTAARELREEGLGLVPLTSRVSRVVARGCPGWKYRTVVAVIRSSTPPPLPLRGEEHDDLVWVTRSEAYEHLPLHPGLYLPYANSAL